MNIQDIHFNHPEYAWLFFCIPFVFILLWLLKNYRETKLAAFANKENLEANSIPRSQLIYLLKSLGICIVIGLMILALMDPISFGQYVQKENSTLKEVQNKKENQHVILLLDSSQSMNVSDVDHQTRFERAKAIADELIQQLTGEKVALYGFSTQLFQLSPFTNDYLFVRLMLKKSAINSGETVGTNLLNILSEMDQEKILNQNIETKLIMLTDGGDVDFELAVDKEKRLQELISAYSTLKKSHIKPYFVGIGSTQGKPVPNVIYQGKAVISALQEDLLKSLAKATNGVYLNANNISPNGLAEEIIYKSFRQNGGAVNAVQKPLVHDLYFQLPLGMAILILGLILFTPSTTIRKTLVCIVALNSSVLSALEPESIVYANALYDAQQFNDAKNEYQSILLEPMEPWQRVLVLYNMGTSLLHAKRWNEAANLLQKIPIEDNFSPLIQYRLRFNLAYSLLEKSKTKIPFSQAYEAIEQAESLIPMIKTAECHLQQGKGQKECLVSQTVEELSQAIAEQKRKLENKKSGTEQEPSENQSSPQTNEETSEKKQADQKENINQVLQLLLEMDQDDNLREGVTPRPQSESSSW